MGSEKIWFNFYSRLKYNPLGPASRKRGIALILAMMSLMFMVYIATEVTRDSAVEYIVNSQELSRIKAFYAARNGMQMALLRIKIYQQATRSSIPESYMEIIDRIGWRDPFFWPLPIPKDLNAVDSDSYKEANSASLMDSTYAHTIEDEGSKIDINDLVSKSKVLRDITKKQLLNVFEQKVTNDEEFRTEYQNTRFDELINRIYDWMSDSNTGADGSGDKRSAFSQLGAGYPPNRGFRTIEEVRLVPGMTDVFFNLLAPRITIYGMKAINPNTASKEVLLSLDSGLTEAAVDAAIERRSDPDKGGPFKGSGEECIKNFKEFVDNRDGTRLAKEFDQIPMVCSKVFNFRIKSNGMYGSGKFALQKNITAIVLDVGKSASQIRTFVDKEKQAEAPGAPGRTTPPPPAAGSTSGAVAQDPLPKGPPRIVYWTEN